MINVGQRITELRKAKNYTTNKLANLSGISQSYLRDVELGKKNISVEFLSYICESLNISLSDFFAEEDINDEFTKALRIFSAILCNFLAAYENFMIFFLFFCKKVLTKRKISAIIPGVGANILAKQRAALCGKRQKSGFL